MIKCPQCHFDRNADNATECDSCGVVFVHLKRQDKAPLEGPGTKYDGSRYIVEKCQFNDHGGHCDHRAIMLVNGTWCCREHGYKLANYGGMEGKRGNEQPAQPHLPGITRWHEQMKAYLISGGHSVTHELVDGEVRQRRAGELPALDAVIESERQREPGDDDE